jgi:hypothetical protein
MLASQTTLLQTRKIERAGFAELPAHRSRLTGINVVSWMGAGLDSMALW